MMKDTPNGQTHHCPSCKDLARRLTATQAQMSELRDETAYLHNVVQSIFDVIPRIELLRFFSDNALNNIQQNLRRTTKEALSATADNEQTVNRIKAQALRELIERYPFFKDREVAWLLGSIKKDIDDIGWRREMSEQGCCWPEQNAIWEFCEKYGIDLSFQQESELKNAVTAPRIEIQHKVESLRAELEAERKKNRELEGMIVMEFSAEEVPSFTQGFQHNESLEVVTAARITGLVGIIQQERKLRIAAESELNHYKQLVEESRKQEPVAWVFDAGDDMHGPDYYGVALTDNGGIPLYAAPIVPQEVPEGWQLVPKELTHYMEYSMDTAIFHDDTCQEIWGETLAAAPEAPKGNANCK